MALALPLLLKHCCTLFHPLPILLVIIFSIYFLLRLNSSQSQKQNLPPSPPKLPIIGNLHQLGARIHLSLRDLSHKYGPLIILQLGHSRTLVVSSAEIAGEIFKSNDIAFANRPFMTAAVILLYGMKDIAFASYGEYFRKVKRICVIELLSIKRVQSFKFVRDQEVELMIQKISRSCSVEASINLPEMLLALSNNIICRCAIGKKHGGGADDENKFARLFRELPDMFGAFSFGDLFPWLGWMDVLTGLTRRMKKVAREIDTFFDETIDEHIARSKRGDENYQKDFLDILLHVQQNNQLNISITRDNIKAMISDMFLAGTDTTTTTIEWAIAELIKNPNTMKKAQEEVRRVVGKKAKVDEEDITQMDYLKCAIKESLRLHPPAPMLIPRETTTDTTVKGYHVPSKTRVFINAWAIQRDSKSWDRAEEFLPDRFLNNDIDLIGQDFQLIPFGAGRRLCPGMYFGLAVVEFVIANLLYWFEWELPGGAKKEDLEMSDGFGFNVNKKNPLHLVPVSQFVSFVL